MSYIEQLRDINSRIRTTSIKGKDYAEVNQRVLAFWELFPEGRISTECKATDTRCDCRAEVYRHKDDQFPAATGHAFEDRKGQINSTSYVENCETSAVGRALGMLGIGATQAICSKEELENAMALQGAEEQPRHSESGQQRKQGDPRYAELNELVKELAARTGSSVSETAAQVVEKYGNPKEMAEAAYRAFLFALRAEVEQHAT